MRKEGISLEKDYQQSYEGSCRVKRSNVKTFIAGFKRNHVADGGAEQRLKLAVSRQPVVVAVSAEFYISYKTKGDLKDPIHSLLIVGYGQLKGKKYSDSCWAYVATSAVETIRKIKTEILKKISSQELIGCNRACNGC
jgi:hypothetical protein